MKPPIGSRLHGTIDYAVGASLVGASRLPALAQRLAGRALLTAGASHVLYSLVTDYELGVVRRLPYRMHLAVDAVAASGLLAIGLMRGTGVDRSVPVGVAVAELTVVALSDPGGRGG